MEQVRSSERRTSCDRRVGGAYPYTGPERRKLTHRRLGLDRRGLLPSVCIYCGKACGADRGWSQGAATIEKTVKCRNGICIDCSAKKFPQFYTDI